MKTCALGWGLFLWLAVAVWGAADAADTQGRLCVGTGATARGSALSDYLNGGGVLGFFAVQTGAQGRYLVVLQEGNAYAVAAVDAATGAVAGKTKIPEDLAQDLQDILQEEIFNAAPTAVPEGAGVLYTLGVKKDGRWLCGATRAPQPGSILFQLGALAQAANGGTPDAAALRTQVDTIQTAYVNDMRPQNNFSKTQAWLKSQADAPSLPPVKP